MGPPNRSPRTPRDADAVSAAVVVAPVARRKKEVKTLFCFGFVATGAGAVVAALAVAGAAGGEGSAAFFRVAVGSRRGRGRGVRDRSGTASGVVGDEPTREPVEAAGLATRCRRRGGVYRGLRRRRW